MNARFITVAALMTSAALFCLPAQAQTGTSSPGTVNSGSTGSSGSVGTTPHTTSPSTSPSTGTTMGTGSTMSGSGTSSNQGTMSNQGAMPGRTGSMGSQTDTMGSGGMSGQPKAHGSASSGMTQQAQSRTGSHRMRGDAAERQMTVCLNNAAAQHQPLDSCRR